MAAENETREERYIKEMKSNLETALLTINNLAIQLGKGAGLKTDHIVAYPRTSGYVNWDSTHDILATKQWQPLSNFVSDCVYKEKGGSGFVINFHRGFAVDEEHRFPANEVYLNTSNPIVGAELLYIMYCKVEPGLLRNLINIAKTDSHTRSSFEEKYGLKWIEPCNYAKLKKSIKNTIDVPASINASETNIKPASESSLLKPDNSEPKQVMEKSDTTLTKESSPGLISAINESTLNSDDVPDDHKAEAVTKLETQLQKCLVATSNAADVIIKSAKTNAEFTKKSSLYSTPTTNEPTSYSDDVLDDDKNAETVLKLEMVMQKCLTETSNAADDVVIASTNAEPYSLVNVENSKVILDQKQVQTCIPALISNLVGVSVLVSNYDTSDKSILDIPKDIVGSQDMSDEISKQKHQQAMRATNAEFTKDLSLDSTSAVNEPTSNTDDDVRDLSLQNDIKATLKQKTSMLTLLKCFTETRNASNIIESANTETHSSINDKNPTVILEQKQIHTYIPVQVSNPVSVSVLANDSDTKPVLDTCSFLMSKNPKYTVDLEQGAGTDNGISGQETNDVKTSRIHDDFIKELSVPDDILAMIGECPKNRLKQEQPQELCYVKTILSEQKPSADILLGTENEENLKVVTKHKPVPETCNELTEEPVAGNKITTGSITHLEQEIPVSLKGDQEPEKFISKQLTETFKSFPDISLSNEILSELASQKLYDEFRDIINHLTILNVDTMVEKIRALDIKNEEELKGVGDIFFDKVLKDPDYAKLYADLSRKLSTLRVFYGNDQVKQFSFKSYVVQKCQDIFESRKSYKHVTKDKKCADTNNKLGTIVDEENKVVTSKHEANIKFIGELYMVKLITCKIIMYIIKVLLNDLDETDLKCACDLLTVIGKQLEYDDRLGVVSIFKKMLDIIDSKTNKISENVHLMVQNVIKLQKNRWVNFNKGVIVTLPKTMEEFQREAEARALNIMFKNACGTTGSGNDGVPDVTNYSIKALKQKYLTPETLDYIKRPPICFQDIADKMYNILEKFQADSRPDHLDYRREMVAGKQDEVFKCEESYSWTNTRKESKTSIKDMVMLPMSRRPMNSLSDSQIRMRVRSAINEYQNNQCDEELVIEVKQNYLDCQHASVINEIINFGLEKVGKEFDLTVKSLFVLVATETISPDNFESGLLETFLNAPDIIIDIPLLYTLLAKILAPHIVKDLVTFSKTLELSENIISSNQGNMFLKELVIQLNESIGFSSVARLWRESGLHLSQWMPEDDVDEWIFDNGFDFLD